MNVSRMIQRHVKESPDKTAIIFEDRRISYLELDRLIDRAAFGLIALGLKRGDAEGVYCSQRRGKHDAGELREYCKPLMAPYKIPVAVAFLDEIPRSAAGKAQRKQLRDKEWDL